MRSNPKNKRRPIFLNFRLLMQLAIMLGISVGYTNCSGFSSSEIGAASLSSNGSGVSCDSSALISVYETGYYAFIKNHNCALCHGTGGSGPALGATDIAQAFGVFEYTPGQFRDSQLNSNAVSPSHNGAGSPSYAGEIQSISVAWQAAVASNCKTVDTTTTNEITSYDFKLKPKSVSLAPGQSVVLTWNLATDVSPASPVNANGVTISATVTAADSTAVENGYKISKLFLSSGATGFRVAGAKVALNGTVYKYGSTFVNSVADIPPGIANFPISFGSIIIATTPTAGDTIDLQLGKLESPTLTANYPIPSSTATVTYSDPVRFSELIQPGGAFSKQCLSCHNPVFKNANLNILDYNSVMQFITPGVQDGRGGYLSPMNSLILYGTSNSMQMPPTGYLSDLSALHNPYLSWLGSLAPNN